MIAVAALALLAVSPPAPPVRAQADLASLFTQTDYPPDAMVRGETGSVGFAVAVAPDGSVSACRVTRSSGSESLDALTCRILTERAHFTPARNAAGDAVADEIGSSVTWTLPQPPTGATARANLASYVADSDYPRESIRNHEQGEVQFELDISPEGRAVNCRVMHSTTGRLLNLRTCQIMLVRARFRPARDAQGNPVPDTISSRLRWSLPD
jgi:TonB family protein